MAQTEIYEIITNQIIEKLSAGQIPWRKPWAAGPGSIPKNLVSKKEYRGINVFMLIMAGYNSPYWLTFNQIKALDGSVIKGSKSTPVIFWKWLEYTEKSADDENTIATNRRPMLKYYRVFNIEQTTGINPAKIPAAPPEPSFDFDPITECEKIVDAMPQRPDIQHQGNQACYSPGLDYVRMPKQTNFEKPAEYYCTLFHELTHSTGHESRLNRHAKDKALCFGDTAYSKEELVAEFGAAFLCGMAGIVQETMENSAAYIQNWLHALKNDKSLAIYAAAQAQKAADFITGRKPDFESAE